MTEALNVNVVLLIVHFGNSSLIMLWMFLLCIGRLVFANETPFWTMLDKYCGTKLVWL